MRTLIPGLLMLTQRNGHGDRRAASRRASNRGAAAHDPSAIFDAQQAKPAAARTAHAKTDAGIGHGQTQAPTRRVEPERRFARARMLANVRQCLTRDPE